MQIHIHPGDQDPFADENAKIKIIRGIGAQFARQQRAFTFSLVIFGHFAKFLRWDRAGCIVSKAFDFKRAPVKLAKFFWGYSQLNAIARGFDPNVVNASEREADTLQNALRHYIEHCSRDASHIKPSLVAEPDPDYPAYKVSVDTVEGPELKLIIRKPFHTYTLAGGRATRVYAAYSVSDGKIVVLKDHWGSLGLLTTEAEIYDCLRQHAVPHTPHIFAAGGVRVGNDLQQTLTQTYSHHRGYIRSRIVQDVYFPLSTIRSSRELVQVFRDAVKGDLYILLILQGIETLCPYSHVRRV